MSGPRSILLLRAGVLGDVVLATSLIDPLRERFPEAALEWVVDAPYAPLLEGLPGVRRVHPLRRGRAAYAALCRELAGRFDLAVDLQNKVRTRFLAFWAAERRCVFVRRGPEDVLHALVGRDVPLETTPQPELYATALRPLGGLRPGRVQVSWSGEAARRAATVLGSAAGGRGIAVAPGTRWETKRWPLERFLEVSEALSREGHPILLLGGPGDRALLDRFRAVARFPVAADLSSLDVEALAAALARVRLLVGCDSGPVHLATAVGTPAVAIFGPTSPVRWGPPPPSRIVSLGLECAPCTNHGSAACPLGHHRCLRDLAAAPVLDAARRLLAGASAAA